MPKDFAFPPGSNDQVEVLLPFQFDPANPGNRGGHFLSVIGRLKPGVSQEQAKSELISLMAGWKSEGRAQHLLNPEKHPIVMVGLHEDVVGSARKAVLLLMGAVGFVLLIACVNVANLLLARAAERRKELALRAALGASRGRLARQLLIESVLLASLGVAAGIGVGLVTMRVLSTFTLPGQISLDAVGLGLDVRVLAFTSVVAIGSAILFGLAPALTSSREAPIDMLRAHGRAGVSGPRNFVLSIQVALSLVLLVAASLFARSLQAGGIGEQNFHPK
jgi:hypothetical protein